jgi:hypothetical protein
MKRKSGIIPRILISLLGLGLILMGSSEIMLGMTGKSTTGVITSIRREGGERDDSHYPHKVFSSLPLYQCT